MQHTNIGVWGLGTYLPPIVRGNDWWPAEIVEQWRARKARRVVNGAATASEEQTSEGMRTMLAAAAAHADDPFEGARERRVMPEGMWPTEMQIAAARDAI